MKLVISLTTDANVVTSTLVTPITAANQVRVLAAMRARLVDPNVPTTDVEVFQIWANTVITELRQFVSRFEVQQAAPPADAL